MMSRHPIPPLDELARAGRRLILAAALLGSIAAAWGLLIAALILT